MFMRPNFPTPEYPSPTSDPNPVTHPDVDTSGAGGSCDPFYRSEPIMAFHQLPHLRPSVQYIFGDLSDLSAPLLKADKMAMTGTGVGGSGGVKKGRVQEHTFEGVGHLIPMEVVGQTADVCRDWLVPELERWRIIEEGQSNEWAKVPKDGKSVMSKEYVTAMTGEWTEAPTGKAKL